MRQSTSALHPPRIVDALPDPRCSIGHKLKGDPQTLHMLGKVVCNNGTPTTEDAKQLIKGVLIPD